jgi:hypothetical protein
MKTEIKPNRLPFYLSLVLLGFAYGAFAFHNNYFPRNQIIEAIGTARFLLQKFSPQKFGIKTKRTQEVEVHAESAISPGLTLISGAASDQLFAKVIDSKGNSHYRWDIDWFKIWPDANHIPENDVPKERPGTNIHGIVLLKDGDLVFNFDNLGMVRLDPCGRVVWKLPYQTHHSVQLADDGSFWAAGRILQTKPVSRLPGFVPPFYEETILNVSSEGKILKEISVMDLLIKNGLHGLLFLRSPAKHFKIEVTDDSLHLNDVEVFSKSMAPGFFHPGDLMISLRDINAIAVFDPRKMEVKYLSIGKVMRQHDPDFVDGNTISIFDNLVYPAGPGSAASKIVVLSALTDKLKVAFEGTDKQPFFTGIFGQHQWLPNGNLLITEAYSGRALEVTPKQEVVWEFYNIIGKGMVGFIDEAQRLGAYFSPEFFEKLASACRERKSADQ